MVSACGGGGGGGTISPAPSAVVLTTWSQAAGKTVLASGRSQIVTADFDRATGIKTDTIKKFPVSDAWAYLTLDSALEVTGMRWVGDTTVSFNKTTAGDTFKYLDSGTIVGAFVGAYNSASQTIMANPKALGWEYQTFGVWEAGLDSNTRTLGAMTVGSTVTPAIPPSGKPTFIGQVAGSYVNADGMAQAVLADLKVDADFGNQTLAFTTLNSRTSTDWESTDFVRNTDLDMTGTQTSFGTSFTVSLKTSSTLSLSGESTGQFYGPNAEELGGTFFLQGTGGTYTGAYGAAQLTP